MAKFLIILLFLIKICFQKKQRYFFMILKSDDSEITLKVKGIRYQYILNEEFTLLPNEIYINGNKTDFINNKPQLNFENELNIVILKWNQTITTCKDMFRGRNNIVEIDLSKFETSFVTNMENMFRDCTLLESINFIYINTSSVSKSNYMFSGCSSLLNLDLSFFDTSKIKNMQYMFNGCKKLEYLNLSNFFHI